MDVLGQRELDRLGAVARLGDDLEVGRRVEHHAQAIADDLVVVGQQDARLQRDGHGPSSSTGIVSRTSVPWSGRDRIESRPPTSRARSRMPAIPAVPPGSCAGIPLPSSATRRVSVSASASSDTRRRAGVRVAEGVGEALLGDPVDDELDVRRQRRQLPLELAPDAKAALGVDPRAERDQRVDEAEVVERLRTQLARDAAHLVQAVTDGVGHAAQGLRRQRRVAVRRPLGLDRHRS